MNIVNGLQLPRRTIPVLTAPQAGAPAPQSGELWAESTRQKSRDPGSGPSSASHLLSDHCLQGRRLLVHTEVWGVSGPGMHGGSLGGGPQESMFTPTLGKTFLTFEGGLAALKLSWLPASSGSWQVQWDDCHTHSVSRTPDRHKGRYTSAIFILITISC